MLNLNTKICYNVRIDPVIKCCLPKVFLLQNGTREGRFATILQSFGLQHSWVNQTVPFGFLRKERDNALIIIKIKK